MANETDTDGSSKVEVLFANWLERLQGRVFTPGAFGIGAIGGFYQSIIIYVGKDTLL